MQVGLHAHYCADEGPLVYTCRGLNIARSVAIEVLIVQLEVQMVGGHIHVWAWIFFLFVKAKGNQLSI